jgi:hypothetical protein
MRGGLINREKSEKKLLKVEKSEPRFLPVARGESQFRSELSFLSSFFDFFDVAVRFLLRLSWYAAKKPCGRRSIVV